LPLGVKETSLLGSIINLIAQIFCVGCKNAREFNLVVGGDDFATINRASSKCDKKEIKDFF